MVYCMRARPELARIDEQLLIQLVSKPDSGFASHFLSTYYQNYEHKESDE